MAQLVHTPVCIGCVIIWSIVDDPSSQVLKGKPCKGATVFESSQSYLILDDEISKDLVCEKVFHLDLIGNHNLIVDKCVLHSNVKYLSAHEPIIVKIDRSSTSAPTRPHRFKGAHSGHKARLRSTTHPEGHGMEKGRQHIHNSIWLRYAAQDRSYTNSLSLKI